MVLIEIAALYAGVNVLLLLALAVPVSLNRRARKIALGDGGDPQMTRSVRAHANAAEYIPAALVGLALLALFPMPAWLIHAGGASLTAGRVIHALGLYAGTVNLGRMLGTALTWLAYLVIGGGLIYAALAGEI